MALMQELLRDLVLAVMRLTPTLVEVCCILLEDVPHTTFNVGVRRFTTNT